MKWLSAIARLAAFAPLAAFAHGSPMAMPTLEGAGGFTPEAFDRFIESQGGGAAPREYIYTGTAYDVPSGRIIATVEGYQQSRVFRRPRSGSSVREAFVARRAFLIYRAPDTRRVIAIYPDVRGSVTTPPLGVVRYTLAGDRIVTEVRSGTKGNVRDAGVPEAMSASRQGAAWVFRRLLVPPNPKEQPVEIQESAIYPRAGGADVRTVMTKVANNTFLPPEGGRHVLHLIWYPIASKSELSTELRTFLTVEAPGMQSLPNDLDGALRELGVQDWPAPLR